MHEWPFADDFDWYTLPYDPLPPPWVRPWRWLDDIRERNEWTRFGEYLQALEARGLGPDFGYLPISDPVIERMPVPWDMVVEELVGQHLLFDHAGRTYRLAAGEPTRSPLTGAVGFVTEPGLGRTVGAIDRQARWTDTMRVTSVAEAKVRPFAVVWDGDRLLVCSDGEVVHESPARLTQAVRSCPMIPGSQPGQLCRQYGGGWVSRSRIASARWLDERDKRLRDVGCDTCGDGAVRIPPYSGQRMLVGPSGSTRESLGPTRFLHPVTTQSD